MRRALAVIAAITFVAACSGDSSNDSARLCFPARRKCGPDDLTALSPRFYELLGATEDEAKCLAVTTPAGNTRGLSAAQVGARVECVPSAARRRELDRRFTEYMSKQLGELDTPKSN